MPEHCDSSEPRDDRSEQLEALAGEITRGGGQSCDVATRASKARDEPELDRFHDAHKDDRHRSGRSLDYQSRWPSRSQDDIDFQAHQLFGKPRKLIDAAVGDSEFDEHILAIDISPLP